MAYYEQSVHDFLEHTGSKAPAPGGGSVAALTASSAAALVEMVANLTIGKKGYEAVWNDMQAVADKAASLRHELLLAIDKDSQAFTALLAAFKLPKDKEEDKRKRIAAIQEATKQAALVPYAMGKQAYSLFALAEEVIQKGNTMAVTDGAIAVINAHAAIKAAFLSVRINTKSIKDKAFVASVEKEMQHLEEGAQKEEKRLLKLLADRI